MYQRRISINEKAAEEVKKIATETSESENAIIEKAIMFYCDSYYCKNKATFLNENVLSSMQGMVDGLEHRLNNKTNQLLSELAIQEGIVAQLLAYSLDVDGDVVADYRKKAVDFLKVNQRVLRLDSIIE